MEVMDMGKVSIEISTDNSAFDDGYCEITRVLNEVSSKISDGAKDIIIRDINGNVVGMAIVK